ncbi:hypothetical protein MBM_09889 [Drepanopeziza brunnea f. sp. 'multigermtubi' MB_m1]|uniref:Uncharacterized protein n=1 Tax=Marssonina brunnea f. sp. multigermtubi (strain MB_m1) TaxID=1072389 RepID=K1XHL2_MARBU|nr:uncharacterized protein MBM_09889 [Drepanopeziza brunnea f. sp. 'multigermtubi' MB_m1]EKD11949.1 hypothetical protein MBM_09889 [Drepanopeziza brunnea f. sp. 'multigermtubi' MB_m1]
MSSHEDDGPSPAQCVLFSDPDKFNNTLLIGGKALGGPTTQLNYVYGTPIRLPVFIQLYGLAQTAKLTLLNVYRLFGSFFTGSFFLPSGLRFFGFSALRFFRSFGFSLGPSYGFSRPSAPSAPFGPFRFFKTALARPRAPFSSSDLTDLSVLKYLQHVICSLSTCNTLSVPSAL